MIFLTLLVVKSSVRTILAELSRPAAVEMSCDLIGTGSRMYLAQGCFTWVFTQWTWEPPSRRYQSPTSPPFLYRQVRLRQSRSRCLFNTG
ncbi:hypothetical protein CCUS01_16745 [Colletotrichum cuscutae]|uniref:Secreted protein n=1 Tax=Colletotrichum cuscutae TaxID=1209917 RepID=A0AAI9Y6D8_9PEZI|nr:hypothetical protein CCUS01_16745 [Colletotrichum cuscutae]